MRKFRKPTWGIKCCSYLLSFGLAFYPALLQANPQGGSVVAGDVHWEESGTRTNIIQESQQAVVNWQSFNVEAAEHVDVQMPSQSSTHLSRVVGSDPSSILGKVTSNGNLYLVNPNGILFGKNAQVDVHGLVATTSDISNEDFLKGNYQFSKNSEKFSSVINEGRITAAEGGLVALVAPSVRNAGLIEARLGKVVLASGETFTLDFYGDQLIEFGVSDSVLESVNQEGNIQADGGTVLLAVQDATRVVDDVINMSGVVKANYAEEKNGEIILSGGSEGVVRVTGKLDASGKKSGETGGKVKVLGDKVGLFGETNIDVSGDSGGGEVLIGGNFQGKGPEQNSNRTHVSPGVEIHAEALEKGDAGRVIVWSDGVTKYFGKSFATGGAEGGDGGLIEVSGKGDLLYQGKSYLGAEKGMAGTLLLDPTNITISTDADSNTTGFGAVGCAGGTPSACIEDFTEDDGLNSVFDVDSVGSFASIGNGATIDLRATGDITVSSAFDLSDASGNTAVNLILRARDDVVLNAAISMDGGANLYITADDDASGVGAISGSSSLTMGTGDLALSAGAGIGSSATNIATVGVTDFAATTATGGIFVTNTGGSAMNITTVNSITGLGATTSGNVRITNSASSGTIAVAAAITANSGFVRLSSGGNITDSAAITASGAGTFTTADVDADITLDQGHAITGGITFSTEGTTGNVTFDNGTTALDIAQSFINGNLVATSGEAITDSGALTVSGTASFTTDVDDKDITLNTTTNAITGAVSFTTRGTGGDVTIDNGTTALNLGASTVDGNLTATSGGAITDSGALTISGTASFTTDLNDIDITLDRTDNAITGAVSFTTNGTGGDVTIDNGTTALNLGASTVDGNLTATSGEAITDSGALTVSGTASFTTDVASKNITLNTTTNAITGAVSFTTTGNGDVTFDNGSTAISIGTFSIGRDLTLTTRTNQTIGTAITLGGSTLTITIGGDSSLTINAAQTAPDGIILRADDDVILNAAGDLKTTTGNITVTADNDSDRNGTGGRITMADGAVSDSGSGTQTFSADENITLGRLVTTNTGTTAITLTSTSGGIVDGGDTGDWDLDAPDGRLVIDAVTGIGAAGSKAAAAASDAIEIRTTSIDIDNTTSGVIDLYEANDVTITKLKNTASGKNVTLSFSSDGGGLPKGWEVATASGVGRVIFTNRNSSKRSLAIEESTLAVESLARTLEKTAANQAKNSKMFDATEHYITTALIDVCEWLDIACEQQAVVWH